MARKEAEGVGRGYITLRLSEDEEKPLKNAPLTGSDMVKLDLGQLLGED